MSSLQPRQAVLSALLCAAPSSSTHGCVLVLSVLAQHSTTAQLRFGCLEGTLPGVVGSGCQCSERLVGSTAPSSPHGLFLIPSASLFFFFASCKLQVQEQAMGRHC